MIVKSDLITMILCILLCIPVSASSAESFTPKWNIGDEWTVKAVFPAGPEGKEWSSPVRFAYSVSEKKESPGKFLVITIRDIAGGLGLTTTLFYRKNGFFMERAEIGKMFRGKKIVKTLKWESASPVQTRHTLTPFDSPGFPIVSPSSEAMSIKRRVGDDLFIRETVRKIVGPSKKDDKIPGIKDRKDLIEVRCVTEKGRLIFTQYWDPKLPWPVYGENENMRYWLDTEEK